MIKKERLRSQIDSEDVLFDVLATPKGRSLRGIDGVLFIHSHWNSFLLSKV